MRHIEMVKGNKKLWDELAPVHFKSYDLEKLRQGGHVLDPILYCPVQPGNLKIRIGKCTFPIRNC